MYGLIKIPWMRTVWDSYVFINIYIYCLELFYKKYEFLCWTMNNICNNIIEFKITPSERFSNIKPFINLEDIQFIDCTISAVYYIIMRFNTSVVSEILNE